MKPTKPHKKPVAKPPPSVPQAPDPSMGMQMPPMPQQQQQPPLDFNKLLSKKGK